MSELSSRSDRLSKFVNFRPAVAFSGVVKRLALLLPLAAGCVHSLPRDPEIVAAVRDLGTDSVEARDAAEAALLAREPADFPDILQTAQGADPESRLRVQRVVRELRRKRAVAGLTLVLHPDRIERDEYRIKLPCSVTNAGPDSVVLVHTQFFYRSRVNTATKPAGSGQPARFVYMQWSHGCVEVHPFEDSDFIEIGSGETRPIGNAELHPSDLQAGRYEVWATCGFTKPQTIDERQFANPRQRELYDRAQEIDGLDAGPVEVVVPERR